MSSENRRFTKKLLHLGKEANSLPHDEHSIALLNELYARVKASKVIVELGHPRLDKIPNAGDKIVRQTTMDYNRWCARMLDLVYHPDTGEVYGNFEVDGPMGIVLEDALSVMTPEQLRFGMRGVRNTHGELIKIVTWDLIDFDQEKKRV